MLAALTGTFFTKFFILLLVLGLPIPSTPYLIFLFGNNPILEAGIIYFTASNVLCLILYGLGVIARKVKFTNKYIKLFDSLKKRIPDKFNSTYLKIKEYPKEALKRFSIWDNFSARFIGFHIFILIPTLGFLRGSIFNILLVNSVYAIGDILFYGGMLSFGKHFFYLAFPTVDFDELISSSMVYYTSVILLISFYLLFGYVKYKKRQKIINKK